MRLLSEFWDYYDHAFDASHAATPVLDRRAVTNRHRRQDHDDLEAAGFLVPIRGTPAEVDRAWTHRQDPLVLVVYTNPTCHAGSGKVLRSWQEAMKEHPDAYCSSYMAPKGPPAGVSYRLVLVGTRPFWLKYETQDGIHQWRSNVNPIVTPATLGPDIEDHLQRCALSLNRPLVAIDFVRSDGLLYAIDLNTAPELRGTPIQGEMRPQEVHDAIAARWEALRVG